MRPDECLTKGVERACADIAKDDADGPDRQLHFGGRALFTLG